MADSNKVPPKINRHVLKAITELAENYPNGVPLPEIVYQVEYQTRNLVPVADLAGVIEKCIENYTKLGVLAKMGCGVYLVVRIAKGNTTLAKKRPYDRGLYQQRKRRKIVRGPGYKNVQKMVKWEAKDFTTSFCRNIAPFRSNSDFYEPNIQGNPYWPSSSSSSSNYVDDGEQPCCSRNILSDPSSIKIIYDNRINCTAGASSTCSDNAERVSSNENIMTMCSNKLNNIAAITKVCSNDPAKLLATSESFQEEICNPNLLLLDGESSSQTTLPNNENPIQISLEPQQLTSTTEDADNDDVAPTSAEDQPECDEFAFFYIK